MTKRILTAAILCILILSLTLTSLAAVHVDITPPADWQERDLLTLTVFRTGEGDAMLLQCGGEAMMIDGGPYKYREKLRDALNERGISHFKYIFSTHPHDDHVEGLRMLLSYGFTTDEFLSPFSKGYSYDLQQKLVRQIDRSGVSYRQLRDGDSFTLGGALITVYWWEQGKTIDAKCPIARVEFGGCSALLCSDIIGETQQYYLKTLDASFLKADVVKAPHHGITPFQPDFLDAVSPAFVFVTNYSNYGTDLTKFKNQMKNRQIPAKYSGDGAVYLETDGADWYVYQRVGEF